MTKNLTRLKKLYSKRTVAAQTAACVRWSVQKTVARPKETSGMLLCLRQTMPYLPYGLGANPWCEMQETSGIRGLTSD